MLIRLIVLMLTLKTLNDEVTCYKFANVFSIFFKEIFICFGEGQEKREREFQADSTWSTEPHLKMLRL